jgi:two-component system OmpR family sensor kinase
MAAVLAVIGVVLYTQFASHLDETINQGLRSRAGDVSALIHGTRPELASPGRSVLDERGESFAQILDVRGGVVDASPRLRSGSLLTPAQVRSAARRTIIFDRPNPFEAAEPARLLATPVSTGDRRLIVVVGAGADDPNSHLESLAILLALGGLGALLLSSLAGYGVAAAALAPVEEMRRKADEITESKHGELLPVGRADDEIARLGATLNGMLARLERAFERERAFVADASHELRTPIAVLKTEIELALRGERTREELVDALRSAGEETERLAELAEALLVIARAEGGRLPLTTTQVDAEPLLAGVRARFDARARASGRRLVVTPTGERVTADARRLEQALDNLVENALLHGDGAIRLSAVAHDGCVELHVRDEGPGFPPEFLGAAFERFSRGDPARGRGGSGLVIARAHGGDARAANHPDGGADLCIELPRGGPSVR